MTAVYKAMQNQILPSTSLSWQSACKTVNTKYSRPVCQIALCFKRHGTDFLFIPVCPDVITMSHVHFNPIYSRVNLRGTGLFHFAPLTLKSLMKQFDMHILANVLGFQQKNIIKLPK